MYGFWSDGSRPAPSAGTAPATCANGDETNAARPAKNAAIPPSTAATHGISSRLRLRFWRSASADGARQDREPQEQRARLAGPERAQRVAGGQPPAGVLGDDRQREVVRHERVLDRDDRHQRGAERGREGVPRAAHEPAVAAPPGEHAGHGRVDREREDEVERDAPERRHGAAPHQAPEPPEEYLLGHFVSSVSGSATNTPPCSCPVTMTWRVVLKASGTEPW